LAINAGGQIVAVGAINGEIHAFLLTPSAESIDTSTTSAAAGAVHQQTVGLTDV
jgi:hypothetical protein